MERTRHKDTNRFKFIPFSERIGNINVDVFHRVPHKFEEESDENTSYLYQAIQKWSDLNRTEIFLAFKKEIGPGVRNLAQVLNEKDRLSELFLKAIHSQNVLSLQPYLELLVAFVKDLRGEFYPYFNAVFGALVRLLKSKDPDILEWTFQCLAYIFKYISRELVKHLDKVLLVMAPLLSDDNTDYVREFAAQSFSFVARKVKDKSKFLNLVLHSVQSTPQLIKGCSLLVFETMRGIKGQLHSSAQEMFVTMFNKMSEDKAPKKLLVLVIKHVIIAYLSAIAPRYSNICDVLVMALKEKLAKNDLLATKNLLMFVHICLRDKGGAHLKNAQSLVEVLLQVQNLKTQYVKLKKQALIVGADLLTLSNIKLPQDLCFRVTNKAMQTEEISLLLEFIEALVDHSSFESTILDRALNIFSGLPADAYLTLLTKIVIHKSPLDEKNFKSIEKYTLKSSGLSDAIVAQLEFLKDGQQFENLLCSLIILRHLDKVDEDSVVTKINQVLEMAVSKLKSAEDKEKQLLILCTAFQTLLYFESTYKESVKKVLVEEILSSLLNTVCSVKSVLSLRCIDLFLTLNGSASFDLTIIEKLCEIIQDWLSSPYTNERTLALHVLHSISSLRSEKHLAEVLQVCLEAERMPLTVIDFRAKINVLQKLTFNSIQTLKQEEQLIPLKYLHGVLYCNFKLLWDPLQEIISSYACEMPFASFWEVFYSRLEIVTEYCKHGYKKPGAAVQLENEFLLDAVGFIKITERADHANYRYLLWNNMLSFSSLCEAKNRDIVVLYLNFIQQELFKSDSKHSSTINIKKNNESESMLENDQVEGADSSLEKCTSRSNVARWALAQLELFSKFRNPIGYHRGDEVYSSFMDLLTHPNVEIQKKALSCLFTYKLKYMTPYKERLQNLIDENKFKGELVNFRIDKDSGTVDEAHRAELMPVVMRIFYSKLFSKAAAQRGNKGSFIMHRRSVVMRFLAGCHHTEMELFLLMAFKLVNVEFADNTDALCQAMNSVNLEKVSPPRKLHNSVNLVEHILKHVGGLMSDQLQRFILRILLSVGAIATGIYIKKDEVYVGYQKSLRNLRNAILDCLATFFDRFKNFPWMEDELEAIFKVFVWPALQNLPSDGVQSPTALHRLFYTWAQDPRYFPLLAKCDPDDKEMTPLPFIMNLLLNEKTHSSVTANIGSMLEKLVTLGFVDEMEGDETMEVDEPLPPLPVSHVIEVDETALEKLSLKEELNYGSKILLPHVGSILEFLRRQLVKSRGRGLSKDEVVVLSRVTEMATSPEHGDALMVLLLQLLSSRRNQQDDGKLVDMVITILNLMNIVTDPMLYIRSLALLFDTVELVQARKNLVQVLLNMAVRCPDLTETAEIIKELNAWNVRWVDQPDFDKRLDAFKRLRVMAQEEKIPLSLATIVVYNCFFFIRCETDLSMRDSSAYCLREVCPLIANSMKNRPSDLRFFIEVILKLARSGIVSKDENVHSSSVQLLGVMARDCGDLHRVLRDLSPLSCKTDLEVDFFENYIHMQNHRRIRALLRFCTVAATYEKVPTVRTLIQFVLPLATRFLLSEKTVKHTLVHAAIQCLSTVCKLLPWQQYQTILKFYLNKLSSKIDFQKELVRIVIAILDSFHYDISKAAEYKPDKPKSDVNEEEGENENENENESEKAEDDNEVDEGKVKEEDEDEEQKEDTEGSDTKGEETITEEKENEEVLEDVLDDEIKEDENCETETKLSGNKNLLQTVTILNPFMAYHVEQTISGSLLEQLKKIIGQKTKVESTHKLNQKSLGPNRDEEDILKVPIAVTLVKLLQKLPTHVLDRQIGGIFLNLCTFLKSRMEGVRRVTRITLQQIMHAVGSSYLTKLIKEMTSLLTKGFQVHVLVFTLHHVIQAMKKEKILKPGDIDSNLKPLWEACKQDIFGSTSEEKEVVQIQAQFKEARSSKSYHLLNLIAQHVTSKCLTDLICPIKEILATSHSHKTVTKSRECLRQMVLGLSLNEYISLTDLMIFACGMASESIPSLLPEARPPPKKHNPRERQDCFIIPNRPKNRFGVLSNPVKHNTRSNAHIIIECGFQLLITLLKREKLQSEPDVMSNLDSTVPVLSKALESQHVKVATLALQCLSKIVKFDLPNLKAEMKTIIDSIFSILHKYAAAGLSKGDNFDLVHFAFKAISHIIRDVRNLDMSPEQFKILLLYAEQDIYDASRQATAFNLLKTVLKRKITVPEMGDLMNKVATLSINSEMSHIRVQARQAVYQYMMDYPLGKQLEKFIAFFIAQLNYKGESGRQSALEMLHSFITHFPMKTLVAQSKVFMLTLGASLVNEESPECRRMVSSVIKALVDRLEPAPRDELFDILMTYLKQKKVAHRRLAAQLAGLFVLVEKEKFVHRLPNLLPVIKEQFTGASKPGQYVRPLKEQQPVDELLKDHHLFHSMQLLLKICEHCPTFLTDKDYQEYHNVFMEISQSLLCYPHEWVRVAAAQFLGFVFTSIGPKLLAKNLKNGATEPVTWFFDSEVLHQRIRSLILDHCAQFVPGIEINEEFVEQLCKNLVYFARALKDFEMTGKEEKIENEDEDKTHDKGKEDEVKYKMSLLWLIRRMRRIVNMEVAQAPNSYTLRTAVIKWIGAVSACLNQSELRAVLYNLIAPVVREREIAESGIGEHPIKSLVIKVSDLIKRKVGVDEYSKETVKLQSKQLQKRAQRKMERTQEFVTDPERAAKRKIERQLKKKQIKKRKLEIMKGKRPGKLKRKRKIDDDLF